MPKVQYYQPQMLTFPSQHPSVQESIYQRNEAVRHTPKTIMGQQTVFYDIFYDSAKKQVIGFGPALHKLGKHNKLMRVLIDNQTVPFSLTSMKMIRLLQVEMNELDSKPNVQVKLQFSEFEETFSVKTTQNLRTKTTVAKPELTLTTLQKDNPVEWIEDWINWHYRLYGINRLILYDNISSNRNNLIEHLNNMDLPVEIILVDWPFEYGLGGGSFGQKGALNHCRLAFPVPAGYCINIDIDEYLVYQGNSSLLGYLKNEFQTHKIGSMRMREKWIPRQHRKGEEDSKSLMRAYDHYFHRRDQGIQASGKTKYIYQYDRVLYNSVHIAVAASSNGQNQKFGWWHQLMYAISNNRKFVEKVVGLSDQPKTLLMIRYAPTSELYYFHFRGLRFEPTKADDPTVEKFDPAIHKIDPSIEKWCKRAGLIPSNTPKGQEMDL